MNSLQQAHCDAYTKSSDVHKHHNITGEASLMTSLLIDRPSWQYWKTRPHTVALHVVMVTGRVHTLRIPCRA
ncbi:hypothetical protein Bpfe_018893 [Biomphalaria pfeifferi]|uniref:Uncharacterized protein n=1 Tax=Biomphalaria pfeifferi TaxID=112525 RepID=A0AAD8F5S3_BIOPF|nr:hypothetical protein Bpfe_018893 [Biomphalaria pfeifferi]